MRRHLKHGQSPATRFEMASAQKNSKKKALYYARLLLLSVLTVNSQEKPALCSCRFLKKTKKYLLVMSQRGKKASPKYVDAAFMYQCLVYIHVPLCHATLSYGHQRAARAKQFVRHTFLHY